MQPRLTDINRREALIYLQYRDGDIPDEIHADLERCCDIILKTAHPRAVWRVFDILPKDDAAGVPLDGTDFRPLGDDIVSLLSPCRQAVLFAATLGAEIETLLRRTQVTNLSDAVMLDACASAAIENVCDNLCADFAAAFSPMYLTDRFSPGYGDFPFAQQPDFCRVLDISRNIGVSLSPSGLMIPRKSVTAMIGISEFPQKKRHPGCAACNMFETCAYRKGGKTCGLS